MDTIYLNSSKWSLLVLLLLFLNCNNVQQNEQFATSSPSTSNLSMTPVQANYSPSLKTVIDDVPLPKHEAAMSLPFVENVGQWADRSVLFQLKQGDSKVEFRSNSIRFETNDTIASANWSLQLLGSDGARIRGGKSLKTYRNYLGDKRSYSTQASAEVWYESVYEGIDLRFYDNGKRELEYDFMLEAGADPAQIRLGFDGLEAYQIDPNSGELLLKTVHGMIRQTKPVVYQELANGRVHVDGVYTVLSDGSIGFDLGDYDRSLPLVIDPIILEWGTATEYQIIHGIKTQDASFAYSEVETIRTCATTQFGKVFNFSYNGYVSKMSGDGTNLLWTTYIGGLSIFQRLFVQELSTGDIVIAYEAGNDNLPTTDGTSGLGGADIYLGVLDGVDGSFKSGTYISTENQDRLATASTFVTTVPIGYVSNYYGITIPLAVDAADNIYVSLEEAEAGFPLVVNPYRSAPLGSKGSYIGKFDSNLTAIGGTYFPGIDIPSIFFDSNGQLLLVGYLNATIDPMDAPPSSNSYFDLNTYTYASGGSGEDPDRTLAFVGRMTPDLSTVSDISYFPPAKFERHSFRSVFQSGTDLYMGYIQVLGYVPGGGGNDTPGEMEYHVIRVPESDLAAVNFVQEIESVVSMLIGVSEDGYIALSNVGEVTSDALDYRCPGEIKHSTTPIMIGPPLNSTLYTPRGFPESNTCVGLSIFKPDGDLAYGTHMAAIPGHVHFNEDCGEFYVFNSSRSNGVDAVLTTNTYDSSPSNRSQGFIQKFSYIEPTSESNVLPDFPAGTSFCINSTLDIIDGLPQLSDDLPMTVYQGQQIPYPNPNVGDLYVWEYSFSSSGPWIALPGSNIEDLIPPINSSEGTYYYRRSIASSWCSDMPFVSNSVEVVINDQRSPNVDMGDPILGCPMDVVTLSPMVMPSGQAGVTGYTYEWSPTVGIVGGGATGSLPASGGSPSIDVEVPGTERAYLLTVYDNLGCKVTDAVTVTGLYLSIERNEYLRCDSNADDIVIGPRIQDPTHTSFSWTPATGLSATNVRNPTVDLAVIGSGNAVTYTLVVNGCMAVADTVRVLVGPDIPKPNSLPELLVCQGEIANLGGSFAYDSNYEYDWLPGQGVANAQNPQSSYQNVEVGSVIYQLVITDPATACSITVPQLVTVSLVPTSGFEQETDLCKGGSVGGGRSPNSDEKAAGIVYSWEAAVNDLGNTAGAESIPSNSEALTFLSPSDGAQVYIDPTPPFEPDVMYDVVYIRTATNPENPNCMRKDTAIIHYFPICGTPNACSSISTSPSYSCDGGGVAIGMSANYTYYDYYWTSVDGLFDRVTGDPLTTSGPHPAVVTANPSMNSSYTITAFDKRSPSYQCSIDIPVFVSTSNPPTFDEKDKVVCLNEEDIMLGGAPVPGYQYQWVALTSNSDKLDDLEISNPTFTTDEAGFYEYLLISRGFGCTLFDTATVVVSEVLGDLGEDKDFCGDSGLLAEVGVDSLVGYTYEWLSPEPENLDNPTDWATNSSTIFTTTTFILEITSELGCMRRDTVIYTDTGTPNPTVGTPPLACNGATVQIGNPEELDETIYNFSWTGPDGIMYDEQAPFVTIPNTGSAPWDYTLTVSQGDDASCSTSVVWSIDEFPELTFYPEEDACDPEGVLIGIDIADISSNLQDDYSFSWDNIIGVTSSEYTSGSPEIRVYPSTTRSYTITATHDPTGCEQSLTYMISPPSEGVDLIPLTLCSNSDDPTIMIQNSIPNAVSYAWSGDGAIYLNSTSVSSPDFDISASIDDNGGGQRYRLIVTVQLMGGCMVQGQTSITINGTTELIGGPDQTVCAEAKITLGVAPLAGHSYNWVTIPYDLDKVNQIQNGNTAQPTVCVTETTTYEVSAISPDGNCVNKDLVTLFVPVENPQLEVMDLEQCNTEGAKANLNDAITINTGTTTIFSSDPESAFPVADPTAVIAGTYYIRSENTEGCFDVDTVSVIIHTAPSFDAVGITNCYALDRSELLLTDFDPIHRYDVMQGTVYSGSATFNTAQPIPADGSLGNQYTASPSGTNYTIRIFDSNNCFNDLTVLLSSTVCEGFPPACMMMTTVDELVCGSNNNYSINLSITNPDAGASDMFDVRLDQGGLINPSMGTYGTNSVYTISNVTAGTTYELFITDVDDRTCLDLHYIAILDEPTITASIPACSMDGSTYSVDVMVIAASTVTTNTGMLTDNGGGSYSITNINTGVDLIVTAFETMECSETIRVPSPSCTDCSISTMMPNIFCSNTMGAYTFDLTVTGMDIGANNMYTISSNIGTVSPISAMYGGAVTFTLSDGVMPASTYMLTIRDANDMNCRTTVEITTPISLTASSANQSACETNQGNGAGSFNLTLLSDDINTNFSEGILSSGNLVMSFYPSLMDAMDNTNVISNTSAMNYASPARTIGVRVEDTNTNCFTTTTVDLAVFNSPSIEIDVVNTACEDAVDSNQATFDLSLLSDDINSNFSEGSFTAGNLMMSFHQTVGDAANNSNVLTTVDAMSYTTGSRTLGVRIENTNTACISTAEVTLNIVPRPMAIDLMQNACENPSTPGAATNINLTELNTTVGTGNTLNTFSVIWFTDVNLTMAVPNPNSVTVMNNTTFHAQVIFDAAPNCSNTAMVQYNILTRPNAMDHSDIICGDEMGMATIDLTIYDTTVNPDTETITWFSDAALTNAVSNPMIVMVDAANNGASGNQFYAQIDNGDCTNTALFEVQINRPAQVMAGANKVFCPNESVQFSDATIMNATTGAWSITNQPIGGDGSLSDENPLNDPSTVGFTATIAGDYTLQLTTDDPDATGPCMIATDELTITVYDNPSVPINPMNANYCNGEAVGMLSVDQVVTDHSIQWFADPAGMIPVTGAMITGITNESITLNASSNPTAPTTGTSISLYARTINTITNCTSGLIELVLTNNNNPPGPSNPMDASYCGMETVPFLSVDQAPAGFEVEWWSEPIGGILITTATIAGLSNEQIQLSDSSMPSAPIAGASTTIYAGLINSMTACQSTRRTAVTLTQHSMPIINAVMDTQCEDAGGRMQTTFDLSNLLMSINSNFTNNLTHNSGIFMSAGFTLAFFENMSDADGNLNTVQNPEAFSNTTLGNQTLFVRIQSPEGCINIGQLQLIVASVPMVQDLNPMVCPDGVDQTMHSGINLTMLENSITNGNTATTTIYWFSNPSLTAAVPDPTNVMVSNNDLFFAQVVFDDVPNCSDIATIRYSVNPNPPMMDISASFCETTATSGNTIVDLTSYDISVAAGTTATVSWFEDENRTTAVPDPSSVMVSIANNMTEMNRFHAQIDDGNCLSQARFTVTVYGQPIAEAGNSQSICATNTADLANSMSQLSGTATMGTWSITQSPMDGDGIITPSGFLVDPSQASFTASIPGDYTLTLTGSSGDTDNPCDMHTDEVVITVYPLPQAIPEMGTVCIDDILMINGNPSGGMPNYTHQWMTTGGTASNFNLSNTDQVMLTIDATDATAGTIELSYQVTDQNGCTITANTSIMIQPKPWANPSDAMLCIGTSIDLAGNAIGGTTPYIMHQWTDLGTGTADPNAYMLSNTNTDILTIDASNATSAQVGTIHLRYQINDINGCSDQQDVTVQLNALPTIMIPSETITCSPPQTVQLQVATDAVNATYNWTGPMDGITEGADTATPTVALPGIYTLVLINTDTGCTNMEEVIVLEEDIDKCLPAIFQINNRD